MNALDEQLNAMGVSYSDLSVLQEKDGIVVARVAGGSGSCVLKYFRDEGSRREIDNYRILASLGVPTIKVIAATDEAILLEDMARSPIYRMGVREDMENPEVAVQICRWYKRLHRQGIDYVARHGEALYDETDFFTPEHIDEIKRWTGTQDAPAWKALERSCDALGRALRRIRKTLIYHDFYYTNLIVAKDCSSAMMFDYNLLGKGFAYADVRNVTVSLSAQAKEAFLAEYGAFDPLEKAADDVICPVVTLYLAYRRGIFPSWAQEALTDVQQNLCQNLERLASAERGA
ncbi:MAG: phosphotransferase [Clostridia bacterium]|nr:phosphotransferase [Clostridia bacterium]